MATKAQILASVENILHHDSITDFISPAIDRAIDHYNGRRFWFTESRLSFTASAGQARYTLSASMAEIMRVQITRNGHTYAINPIPEAERMGYDSSNITGDPSWYSTFGNIWIPYPQPNQTYFVELAGTRKAPGVTLTASGSASGSGSSSGLQTANVWTVHAEELIEARAGWYVAAYNLRDGDAAAVCKQLEGQAYYNLQLQQTLRAGNRVTPTDF